MFVVRYTDNPHRFAAVDAGELAKTKKEKKAKEKSEKERQASAASLPC